jgi:predicted small secreted protein
MLMKLVWAIVVALALLLAHANAVLKTGEDMRANASDIMVVSVISVETTTESESGDPCVTVFVVSGRVLAVNASSIDAIEGDRVAFGSFGVDTESAGCLGYAGPLPPPKLEAGWCGLVYLKQNEDGGLWLAAYGHSFVPTPDATECLERPVEASEVDGISIDSTQQIFSDDGDEDKPSHRSGSRMVSVFGAMGIMAFPFLFL